MKSNYPLIKKILIIVLTSIIFITSTVLFIQSISAYSGEYGSGFDANLDYVVVMLVSLCAVLVSIYNLKGTKVKEVVNTTVLATSIVVSGYSLGKFIKSLVKGAKYVDCQTYFYAGLVALALVAVATIEYLIYQSNKENK